MQRANITIIYSRSLVLLVLLVLVGCGGSSDSSTGLPVNDDLSVREDADLVFADPVYFLHGYVRFDNVGIQLLSVDETFEMQFTEATFSATSGVLRVSGLCSDILINTERQDNGLMLDGFRDTRSIGCMPSFVNETLTDTSRTVLSVLQSEFVELESTEDFLLFRLPTGELLAFSTQPLRLTDRELNDEVDLSNMLWTLESVRTLETGIAAVPLSIPAIMRFGTEGNLSIDLGCSAGSGGALVSTGIISVIDLSFTESFCTISEASLIESTPSFPVELVENFFSFANARPLAYSLKNNQLTLFNGRNTALVFSGRVVNDQEFLPEIIVVDRGNLVLGGLDASDAMRRADIIRDQIGLDAAYTALAMRYGLTELQPPVVDFNRYTVIAAYFGYQDQSGFEIAVRDAVETERGLDVYLTSRDPDEAALSPDCVARDAESAPFSFVLIDSRQTPVTTRIQETSFCTGL